MVAGKEKKGEISVLTDSVLEQVDFVLHPFYTSEIVTCLISSCKGKI